MCVGVPMRILETDGLEALCEAADGRRETLDLALVGPLAPGTHVLAFLGAAREVLDPERARLIAKALEGMIGALTGRGLGDAFADLEAREPTLPPHLEEARRRGASTG